MGWMIAESSPNVSDHNEGGVGSQPLEVVRIGGRDHRAARQIGDGHGKRVHRQLRSRRNSTEELTGPDPDASVDGMDLDSFPSQCREHPGVRTPTPDDL